MGLSCDPLSGDKFLLKNDSMVYYDSARLTWIDSASCCKNYSPLAQRNQFDVFVVPNPCSYLFKLAPMLKISKAFNGKIWHRGRDSRGQRSTDDSADALGKGALAAASWIYICNGHRPMVTSCYPVIITFVHTVSPMILEHVPYMWLHVGIEGAMIKGNHYRSTSSMLVHSRWVNK